MKKILNKKGQSLLGTVLKKTKVGLYDPFLDTLGGGEKHILSIINVLAEQGGEITVFWNKDLSHEIKNRFSFQCFKTLKWLPINLLSFSLKTLRTLRTFNYFFYVTDGSYFFSFAKKNFVFCMVPDIKLYNLNLLNRLKLWNYRFISNSPYTTKWLEKWGLNPIMIPPYVDDIFFLKKNIVKQKMILSVGRFFPHLHSKNQEKIIKTFKFLKLSNPSFKDCKLILAGGLKNEDKKYFNQLKSLVKNDPSIEFRPNVPLYELYELYELSNYFWHFTGLGINEELHPERVEHFGIAPLEAIASGCLTFCYNSGGPKEILEDRKTAFLFNDEEELIKKMSEVEKNQELQERVINQGKKMIKDSYNYEVFRQNVLKTVLGQGQSL